MVEVTLPTFKETYGDFGGYILACLKSGRKINEKECTAQLQKGGFVSSAKILKDTSKTVTIATSFHIPDNEGKIHHYDINLYKFSRKKVTDANDWVRQSSLTLRENEAQELLSFFIEQNSILGIKFDKKYANVFFSDKKISSGDIEEVKNVIKGLSDEELIRIILSEENKSDAISRSLPNLRVDLLEKLITELTALLDKNEKAVQNWLDEDPILRCLIFGLEYVDYKREAGFGNSKFDVLTDISGTEHVIIELKSPNKDFFTISKIQLKNGFKSEYSISPDLAEAIPQTLKYFRDYENETEETFIKNGTTHKKVPKAIIVIGRNIKDDKIWQDHYCDLANRVAGIEMLTYDHLIEKMRNQLENLKNLDK